MPSEIDIRGHFHAASMPRTVAEGARRRQILTDARAGAEHVTVVAITTVTSVFAGCE